MTTNAIAIIPARGGSKRIPRKNIKLFCGKPIIAYSIETAIKSQCFDQIIVSTDDQEIADIAVQYGAVVPHLRSKELSDDYATTIDVMSDAVTYLSDDISYVCCIYATAPLLIPSDLQKGFDVIRKNSTSINYAFSVTEYPFPIQRAITLNKKNEVSMFDTQYAQTRSQDLIPAWHDAGQFYWGKTSAWKNKCEIFTNNSIGIEVPRHRSQDIDTAEDWLIAESLFKTVIL